MLLIPSLFSAFFWSNYFLYSITAPAPPTPRIDLLVIILLLFFFFLPHLQSGISRARDQTCATAATQGTAVKTLGP